MYEALVLNRFHHELLDPITAITVCTQLLRRQILRADGLTNLERDQMLGTVASIASTVLAMEDHVQARLALAEPTQEHKNTRTQEHKNTRTQEHKNTEARR
jgi:hypothetical protein